MRDLARAPRLTVGASYHTELSPCQISSSFSRRKFDPGALPIPLETVTRGTRVAGQRARRALRTRSLAVQQAELAKVARTEQCADLVEVEDRARLVARRTAGVPC